MIFGYEFDNERLKMLVEKKAEELNISVDRLIWNYVNRGLMEDTIDEDLFREVHSEEYLTEVKEALGIEYPNL